MAGQGIPCQTSLPFCSCLQGCRAALQGYGSGIDDDLALLRSGTLAKGSPEEAALVVSEGSHASCISTYSNSSKALCYHTLRIATC
jgi:hypothetical protein